MSKPIEFHRLALEEAQRAFRWYAKRSNQAALRFRDQLRQALVQIQENPKRWPEYLEGTQVVRLRRFPYLIVFRETEREIAVFAVAHGHRRQGYWRRRLN
jgi:plasmid stabilization system protein ParE